MASLLVPDRHICQPGIARFYVSNQLLRILENRAILLTFPDPGVRMTQAHLGNEIGSTQLASDRSDEICIATQRLKALWGWGQYSLLWRGF
ncbi:hypothetical protein DSO57_1035985 [Entomophthora muscae]|uniref:Uncharacterized protein n=1 Tax=Entomophthora muscae TaxID=34485 RepID=A0ACC2SCC7_9FUNG|nr:hypothetical protein DSO57_1035985 [Entomophthora muscae]